MSWLGNSALAAPRGARLLKSDNVIRFDAGPAFGLSLWEGVGDPTALEPWSGRPPKGDGTRSSWSLPYAAIEPPARTAKPAVATEPPPPPRPTRNDFRCGEKVAFEDKYLNTVVGTIVRINQRTATIDPGDRTTWRVGFHLLRHVVDI